MRIDLSEHSDLVRGASEVEETPDGVRCSRFTERCFEKVFARDGAPADSACATSGVRVALVTDAGNVRMRLARGRTFAENGASVDILVDRAECHSFRSDEDAEDFVVSMDLEPAEEEDGHELEIYLPHLSEVLIRDFELSDGSLFRPSYAGDERILFAGDAVTQGRFAASPFRTYPALLAAEMHTDFLNWGVTAGKVCADLAEAALEMEWQSAVLACGAEDYKESTSRRDFEAELRGAISHLSRRGGARIFAVTPWRLPELEKVRNRAGMIPDDYRKICRETVREFPDAVLLDGASACKDVFQEIHEGDSGPMTALAEAFYRKLAGA